MIQNENEKHTYSFRSTSPEIMNQILMRHPEIYDLFPCHLSKKNAIDKHLMNFIIHAAVKDQDHGLIYIDKKENQLAAYILHKLNNSPVYQI